MLIVLNVDYSLIVVIRINGSITVRSSISHHYLENIIDDWDVLFAHHDPLHLERFYLVEPFM